MTYTPVASAQRSPALVRRYFVAPPDEQEKADGIKYLMIGLGLAFGSLLLLPATLGSGGSGSDLAAGLLVGVFLSMIGWMIGLPLGLFGAYKLFRYYRQLNAGRGAPTNVQMEQWLGDDIKSVRERAAKELDIPDEIRVIEPQLVIGAALPTDYAIGVDGVPRFASYEAAIIYLTQSFLSVYTCVINLITGELDLETTYEFALQEVTAIATVNDRSPSYGGVSSGRAVRMDGSTAYSFVNAADISVRQEFRITLISGDAMSITVGAHVNGQSLTREKSRQRVTNAVKVFRSKLREIKNLDDL
jgi:hypothetical protein